MADLTNYCSVRVNALCAGIIEPGTPQSLGMPANCDNSDKTGSLNSVTMVPPPWWSCADLMIQHRDPINIDFPYSLVCDRVSNSQAAEGWERGSVPWDSYSLDPRYILVDNIEKYNMLGCTVWRNGQNYMHTGKCRLRNLVLGDASDVPGQ